QSGAYEERHRCRAGGIAGTGRRGRAEAAGDHPNRAEAHKTRSHAGDEDADLEEAPGRRECPQCQKRQHYTSSFAADADSIPAKRPCNRCKRDPRTVALRPPEPEVASQGCGPQAPPPAKDYLTRLTTPKFSTKGPVPVHTRRGRWRRDVRGTERAWR